jgi:hypothetical protein
MDDDDEGDDYLLDASFLMEGAMPKSLEVS